MLSNEEASALRQILPYDFYAFFEEAWHIIEPSTPFQANWHIEYLCSQLQEVVMRVGRREHREKDIIINVPPGSTKTTLATIMLHPWAWTNFPGMKFISASYDGPLATGHATKSRDIIESDWYQQLFGDKIQLKRDMNRKTEYTNTAAGMRYSTSVRGGVTGKHADIIIIDDPIDPRRVASDVTLNECIEWYDHTLSGRNTDERITTRIIIMQRLHELDLTGHLLKDPQDYQHYCFPGELTPDVKPPAKALKYVNGLLDPVRIGNKSLARHRKKLGSMGYAGQILQSPQSPGGNIIKEKYFRTFRMADLDKIYADTGTTPVWDFVVDGAMTAKQINDPSGIFAYTNYANNTYIRSVQSVFLELPELIKFINDFCIRNGHTKLSRVFIEPKASGHSAEQMLRKYSKLNVQLDKSPTDDKVTRAMGTLPYLESGRCYILEDAPWLDEFIGQVTLFPRATHDEYVDLLSMAIDKVERPTGSSILNIESF